MVRFVLLVITVTLFIDSEMMIVNLLLKTNIAFKKNTIRKIWKILCIF